MLTATAVLTAMPYRSSQGDPHYVKEKILPTSMRQHIFYSVQWRRQGRSFLFTGASTRKLGAIWPKAKRPEVIASIFRGRMGANQTLQATGL